MLSECRVDHLEGEVIGEDLHLHPVTLGDHQTTEEIGHGLGLKVLENHQLSVLAGNPQAQSVGAVHLLDADHPVPDATEVAHPLARLLHHSSLLDYVMYQPRGDRQLTDPLLAIETLLLLKGNLPEGHLQAHQAVEALPKEKPRLLLVKQDHLLAGGHRQVVAEDPNPEALGDLIIVRL